MYRRHLTLTDPLDETPGRGQATAVRTIPSRSDRSRSRHHAALWQMWRFSGVAVAGDRSVKSQPASNRIQASSITSRWNGPGGTSVSPLDFMSASNAATARRSAAWPSTKARSTT